MKNTNDKKTKLIRRIARIWSFPIIAYALIMLIGYAVNWITIGKADPYATEGYPLIENFPPIFLFLAIVGLGIAWRSEKIGGIINLAFCSIALPIILIHWPITEDLRYLFPVILLLISAFPGILFLVYWRRSIRMEI